MLKKLTNNIGLKLLSLVAAAVVWLVVVNIDDPVSTRTISGISVTIKNDSIVTDEGKVYEVLDSSDSISVTIKAKRSILDDLSVSDIVATADMQEMDVNLGLVPIYISVTKNSNKIEEITSRTKNVKIDIQDYSSIQFPISAQIEGSPQDGYEVDTINITPNVLKVSGAASAISKISKVVVKVDVNGMGTDMNLKLQPILLDSLGNAISNADYQLNYNSVDVQVTMTESKTVPVKYVYEGNMGSDYIIQNIECNPESISLKGAKEDLAKISEIVIPSDIIDLSSASQSLQTSVDITKYLPEGVSLADSADKDVSISIIIEKIKEKTIEIPVSKVKISNLTKGLSAKFSQENISLEVKAVSDIVEMLTSSSFTLEVDLEKYVTAGEYQVPITITAPTGVTLKKDVTVGLVIAESE